jgi:hypothetical protein
VKATAARAGTLVRAHARGRPLRAGEAAARVKAGLAVAELDALRDVLDLTVEDLARRIGHLRRDVVAAAAERAGTRRSPR